MSDSVTGGFQSNFSGQGQFIDLNGQSVPGYSPGFSQSLTGQPTTVSILDSMGLTENQKFEVDNRIRTMLNDFNLYRRFSYSEETQIDEIFMKKWDLKPMLTPVKTIEDLKRNILSFSLLT